MPLSKQQRKEIEELISSTIDRKLKTYGRENYFIYQNDFLLMIGLTKKILTSH